MGSDWILTTLGEHISIKHGFAFKGEFFKESPTYDCLITPGNFSIGGGFKGDKLKYYEGPVSDDYILKPNDLVVTMTDLSKEADTLGYSALIPSFDDKRLLHNQRIGLVHFKDEKVDKTFLYFLLRSRMYRHHVVSGATGTTVKHTSPSKILSYEFRLPPKSTQLKIGQKLYDLEKKITLNRQINQTLEQMAQALFKSWFVDFDPVIDNALDAGNAIPDELQARAEQRPALRNAATQQGGASAPPAGSAKPLPDNIRQLFPNEFEESELGWVPKGWGVKNSGDEIDVRDGTHASPKQSERGYPLVTSKNLTSGRLDLSSTYLISPEDYEEVNKRSKVECGDILLTMIGTLGIPCLVGSESVNFAIKNVGLFRTSLIPTLKNYFFQLLRSPHMQRYLDAHSAGTTQKYLSLKVLRNIPFVRPSDDILESFNSYVNLFEGKIQRNLEQIDKLALLRDTLLPKLISGELRLDEVEDTIEETITA